MEWACIPGELWSGEHLKKKIAGILRDCLLHDKNFIIWDDFTYHTVEAMDNILKCCSSCRTYRRQKHNVPEMKHRAAQ